MIKGEIAKHAEQLLAARTTVAVTNGARLASSCSIRWTR